MQCFTVSSNEIEGRLDCFFYAPKNQVSIKSKFPLVTVKDVTINVIHPPEYKRIYATSGYQLLRAQNVRPTGIEINNNKVYFEKEYLSHKRLIFAEIGDVLVVRSGVNTGDCAVINKEYENLILGSDNLVCKCNDKINPFFLQVYLNSEIGKKILSKYQTGATNYHITPKNLKKIELPLPPLPIQNQIVSIMQSAYSQKKQMEDEAQRLLDSIDGYVLDELGIKLPEIKIKKCFLVWNNEVVQRLDPLYYSKNVFSFLNEFSYHDVKPLERITYYLKTGFAAGSSQQELVNEGIIQIRPTNIDDIGLLRFDKNIYLKKEYLNKKNNDLLQKGEVLFNNTNSQELVGKTSFFDLEGQYFCSNHITRIKVNEDFISPIYLCIILNIYQKAKIFFNLCTNWNNQSGVNIELLKTVKVPLPPLPVQNKIAEEVKSRISEAERLKAEANKIIEEAKKTVEDIILLKD